MGRSSVTTVRFQTGNTYQCLPNHKAKGDRSGEYLKIHDWNLYVDILQGDPDVIHQVTFDLGSTFHPPSFVCASPVPVSVNGKSIWRFQTRQQSYEAITATVRILGAGGTLMVEKHTLNLESKGRRSPAQTFTERKPPRPMRYRPLAPDLNFGMELEMTSDARLNVRSISRLLKEQLPNIPVKVFLEYQAGRNAPPNCWKLVPDGSIVCNRSNTDCNKFELVSPILRGGKGLSQVAQILQALKQFSLKVNRSTGFHVHVDVSTLQNSQLVKLCQNFIKYEEVVDSLLPPSRRTGSEESNRFFRSNRESVPGSDNRERILALSRCEDVNSLAALMNGNNTDVSPRYYKLNLQNLVTGRQTTVEFRQHSATVKYPKVAAWIRFCMALVENLVKFAPPMLLSGRSQLELYMGCSLSIRH